MSRLTVLTLLLILLSPVLAHSSDATQTYQTPEQYLANVFGEPPPSATLWLTGELGEAVADTLGHKPRRIRERYWARDNRSVWILEEIGKERPITMAFLVDNGQLADASVLIYRESRGWEIRLPRFTRQFDGATLNEHGELDRDIDGITGATLSVRAMERVARLALLFHAEVSGGSEE